MFERIRRPLLRFFRVPHEPAPPTGGAGSLRVFRAGRNYYKLRLARWALAQLGAVVGIVFSLGFLSRLEREVEDVRAEVLRVSAEPDASARPAKSEPPAEGVAPAPETPRPDRAGARARRIRNSPVEKIAERFPGWLFPLLNVLEWAGVLLYLVQIPITYAMARLDYELRWYMVTDRSLRIRVGLTTVLESTMSFANVQQVVVSQGPLQRVLGIADVRVQSAGGGGDDQEAQGGESLHRGVFHSVDNAVEIRDLILERLRLFREAGLGDPDEAHARVAAAPIPEAAPAPDAIAAARELLAEARLLRTELARAAG